MKYSHWLDGAIDFHVHSAPDSMPRSGSAIELARDAKEAGMRGIVFKDHFTPSFVKAQLAAEVVEGIEIVGGLCLNNTSGGMNSRFVKWGIKAGAKQIMFPTLDSRYNMTKRTNSLHFNAFNFGAQMEPVKVIENGKVTPETAEIIHSIAEADIILSTGHMDGEEIHAILEACGESGVKKIIMEHPNFYIGDAYTMEDLLEFAESGVYLSLSMGALHPLYGKQDPKNTAAIIKAAGAEHCIMMTDYGQAESSSPTEGMKVFCEIMLRCGISQEEIYTMTKYNPAKLLDLD